MSDQRSSQTQRLEAVLRRADEFLGATHVVMEGPNARWIEYDDDDGQPDGFYDEDLVCRPDCPICAVKREIAEALT